MPHYAIELQTRADAGYHGLFLEQEMESLTFHAEAESATAARRIVLDRVYKQGMLVTRVLCVRRRIER